MQGLVELGHLRVTPILLNELRQGPHQVAKVLAEVLSNLSSCKVEGLNAVSPLPYLGDSDITIVLLDPVLTAVTSTAHNLHAGADGLTGEIGEMRLDYWCE